nr:hypothetical protein [Tanacetum cinerariifolium]
MAPLTFTDTHNMVAFLSKSDARNSFDQIVDFINAHTIQYALIVNPTIYVSCIKKFWATAKVKKVNDVDQLQALIDGKKVAVSEAIIRRDLHLDDADGVECLPNAKIFEELARMGYTKPPLKLTFYKAFFFTQWKFLIHTLVQCRKFNFSKYIFDNMVKNVDGPSKVLMFPRFIQVFLDHQVDDMTAHNTRYTPPTLTQNVFANMRRVGKGFSCVETPLFPSMLVQPQQQAEEGAEVAELEKDRTSQALEIIQLKKRVKMLERKQNSKTSGLKRLRRVGAAQIVESSSDTVLGDQKDASKQGKIAERSNQDQVNAVSKGVSVVSAPKLVSTGEPIVFANEDVIMTMAQTLIKLKAEKATILDEQIAQKLHDKEVQKAAASEQQERADMERALELQKHWMTNKRISIGVFLMNNDCEVHHVSSTRGHDIFMLTEKDYPLSNVVMISTLSEKLQVKEDNEMARDLVMKIFMEANKPKFGYILLNDYLSRKQFDKENYLEHHIPAAPVAPPGQQVPPAALAAHAAWELKAMYSKQAKQELLQTVREFHTYKQEEGQSVSSHVLKIKAILKTWSDSVNQLVRTLQNVMKSMDEKQRKWVVFIGNLKLSRQGATDPGMVDPYAYLVSKNNLVYFMAVPWDGIFEIDMSCSNTNDSSMYANTNKRAKINLDFSLLWYCRLGHISKKRIKMLQHDGILNSIDIELLGKCVSCMSGKMASKPYSHQVERAKDLLGLIHTDVCSPFKIVSRQGASYLVTFTDDFSHYGYVYLLKHKHEVFETFKVFQKEVKNQLMKTIKSLHSDREGRRNQTLLDTVRSMISQTTLPKSFWDYALETAARILNMVPTKKVNMTPYEICHGQAPKLSYLKVWGSALLDPESKKWLDAMNVEMQSMKDNDVWVLVEPPPNARTVGSKWLFKKKNDMDGTIYMFKARLVAKGFT